MYTLYTWLFVPNFCMVLYASMQDPSAPPQKLSGFAPVISGYEDNMYVCIAKHTAGCIVSIKK